MADIAVIHRYLQVGGGESVCFHILDALQEAHDIHLYALNHPDLKKLNQAFGTDVNDVTIHTPTICTRGLSALESGIKAATDGSIGAVTGLELSVLSRRYRREWDNYDLRVSTHGELPLSAPAIQYLHHPFLNRWSCGGHFEIESRAGKALNWLYAHFSGANPEVVRQSCLLTNSAWSATQIERIYSIEPEVVYPPITIPDNISTPWEERENGFVSIGRISPDKRTHVEIEIIDELRDRGEDVHLHHVGPIDEDAEYGRQILNSANQRDWITLEGSIPQNRLYDLLGSHRWGLHTKPFEHFGMAVAEMVASGTVPFVPDTGGQTEVVGNQERVLYSSSGQAVRKAQALLEDPEMASEVRLSLPEMRTMCGESVFRKLIRRKVEESLK